VAPFRSERRASFDEPPERLWAALTEVDGYQRWWPWLADLEVDGGFDVGASWRCQVRPPLPYSVRFALTLQEVEPPRFAVATIAGDIEGHASLDLTPRPGGGTDLRLVSVLQSANRTLRLLADLGPPVVRFGHDWVLDTGLRQFRERALGSEGNGERKP
jgi:uncharacterized protein YndB with AHSA1/START domain